jgi:hypothetical protein
MGFIVSFSLFFLALVINQSTIVGQTTAESVLEFPKNDIRDLRMGILRSIDSGQDGDLNADFVTLALTRKNAAVMFEVDPASSGSTYDYVINIHYGNGVTVYNETAFY